MAAPPPALHRLSPELYDRIVDAGLLEGAPVERVDGLLIQVSPQGAEHSILVQRLTRQLGARLELLRVQMPLAVPGGRPEPDLALAPTKDREAHPAAAALVVEVMVRTHAETRAKLPGYAGAGIPMAWLVNLPARTVHVHTRPAGRRYLDERVRRAGDT